MKTINEHISLIEEWLQAYKPNDDFDIPRGVILSHMNSVRSTLIREDLNSISSNMYQRIDCLEIKNYESKCKVDGYVIDYKGLPYIELPNLVNAGGREVNYIGTIDLQNKANMMSLDGLMSMKHSQWSKNTFSYVLIDGKAYLVNLPECKTKSLTAVVLLDNPMELTDNWDELYPCHSDHRLFVLTTQRISSAYNFRPEDFNNARYDVSPVIPQEEE